MEFVKNESGCIKFTDTSGIPYSTWELFLNRINWLGYAIPDVEFLKEYFDRKVFLQKDQSIEILKVLGLMHEKEEYSKEFIAKQNAKAIEHFGITNQFHLAGYMLSDGQMLNFSEDGYIRTLDHRAIVHILDDDFDGNNTAALIRYMSYGNIRLLNNGIDICKQPTTAQKRRLSEMIITSDDFYVDISNTDGHTVHSKYYPIPSVSEILQEIDEYFNSIKI